MKRERGDQADDTRGRLGRNNSQVRVGRRESLDELVQPSADLLKIALRDHLLERIAMDPRSNGGRHAQQPPVLLEYRFCSLHRCPTFYCV